MFNITCHQETANSNNDEIPQCTYQDGQNVDNPNASEDVKQQELSFIADECEKHIATSEDSVVASYNNVFMPQAILIMILCYTSELKTMSTQKPSHMFYRRFIHSFQNLESSKMSFNR